VLLENNIPDKEPRRFEVTQVYGIIRQGWTPTAVTRSRDTLAKAEPCNGQQHLFEVSLPITVTKGKVEVNIGIIEQESMDIAQELDIEAFWEKNAPCQAFT
jgi:hypothetical protein